MRLNVSQERVQERGHRSAPIPFGFGVAGTRPPIASVPGPEGDTLTPSGAAPESPLAGRRVAPLVMGLLVRALGTPALDAAPDVARELRSAGEGSDPSFATVVRLA